MTFTHHLEAAVDRSIVVALRVGDRSFQLRVRDIDEEPATMELRRPAPAPGGGIRIGHKVTRLRLALAAPMPDGVPGEGRDVVVVTPGSEYTFPVARLVLQDDGVLEIT